MRTGVIFYVKPKAEVKDLTDLRQKLKNHFPDADDFEVAIPPDSEDEMLIAWWRLTVKGVKRVLLRFVELEKGMEPKFSGKEMILAS